MTLRHLFNLHHLFIFLINFFCPAKEHCRSYREWELQTRSIALKSGVGGGGWPSPTSRKAEKGVGTLTWLILKIVFLRCLVYLLIQCLIVKWIVHIIIFLFKSFEKQWKVHFMSSGILLPGTWITVGRTHTFSLFWISRNIDPHLLLWLYIYI